MAQQTIGIGTAANDGSGDSLRAGGLKINANFTELYNTLNTAGLLMPLVAAALNSLPTTLPATSGQWWINGGVLSKS